MLRKASAVVFLLALAWVFPVRSAEPAKATWYPLAGGPTGSPARLDQVIPVAGGLDLMLTVPGLRATTVGTRGGPRGLLELPGSPTTASEGRPRLPVLRYLVEAPPRATLRLDLSVPSTQAITLPELGIDDPILPVQPPVPKIEGAEAGIAFVENEELYASDRYLPGDPAVVAHRGVLRGREVVLVEVRPVLYNPFRAVIETWSHAVLRIRFEGGDPAAGVREKDRLRSRSLDGWLDRTTLDGTGPDEGTSHGALGEAGGTAEGAEGMLIVVHDNFVDAVQPLVDWKRKTGFKVEVIRTSELGPVPSDNDVKAAIQQRYDTWAGPSLGFVLMVGDTDYTPIHTGNGGGNSQVTDNWYACVDGPDYLPDLAIARISTRTTAETTNVVNKLLTYERATFLDDVWAKKAGFIGTSDSGHIGLIEGTHDWCIDTYYTPNGFLQTTWSHGGQSCDRHYYTYDADTSEIAASIDEGRTIVNYSGHGSVTSWQGPTSHGGYDQGDVRNNTNDGMYPFVISNACVTGSLASTECFGETWQKEPNKGSIAFWGASNNSYWDEDDVLQRALHGNIFPMDGSPPIGVIVNDTKLDLYSHYGNTGTVAYYFDMYNLLSEPSLSLWTRQPRDWVVEYTDAIPIGESSFTVTVTFEGQPVEGALVAVRKSDEAVFEAGYTDTNGEVTILLDPAPQNVGTMDVTSTMHDFRPHEGTAEVISPDSPWLLYRAHSINDTVGGDGDGETEPGETFVMPVTVENVGEQPGNGLNGTLTTTTPEWCLIEDGSAGFPDLLPHEQGSTLPDHYSVHVLSTAPDRAMLRFEIAWTASDGSSGTTKFSRFVAAPALVFGDESVDDGAGGNDDGFLDPGETATLHVRLDNPGSHDAGNVSGILSCDSEHVTVVDDTSAYDDVSSGQSGWTIDDHYKLEVAPGAPAPFWTTCTLEISANYGYETTDTFRLPISGRGEVLVIDDQGGTSAVTLVDTLTDLAYSTTSVAAVDTDPDGWWEYNFLVWSCGDSTSTVSSATLRQRLEEFVEAGGRVILEGGDLCRNHDDEHPTFASAVLAIDDFTSNPDSNLSCYDDEHPVSTLPNDLPGEIDFAYSGTGSSDACIPSADASGVYDWTGVAGRFGIISRDDDGDPDNGGQQITLAFSIDGMVSESERRDLLENASQWITCTGGPHVLHHSHDLDDSIAGNSDGVVDPGETVEMSVRLRNTGMGHARNVVARLTSDRPEYVSFADNYATYPDIPDGGSAVTSDLPHYTFLIDPATPCGTEIEFTLEIVGDGLQFSRSFPLKVGTGGGGEATLHSTGTPMSIPNPGIGTSVIQVSDAFGVGDVTATLSFQHSSIERVKTWLRSPEGTEVVLHDRSGSGTSLDETYDTTRQPDGPGEMWWFDAEVATGDWTLYIQDFDQDMLSGLLNSWSLWFLRGNLCTGTGCPHPVPGEVGDTLMVDSLGGSDIRLDWTGIPDAHSYVVWRSSRADLSGAETVGNSGAGNTWYEETGARNDAPVYYYVVRAANPCLQQGD
jgi:subtilisin-like proprotein convertase family protein